MSLGRRSHSRTPADSNCQGRLAQLGRAPGLQPGGRGFKSPSVHHYISEDTHEEAQEINRNQNGRSVEQNCLEGLHQLLSPNSSSSPSAIATPSSSIGSSCMPGLVGIGLSQCLLSSELSQYLQEPPKGHLADSRDLADLALSPRRRTLLRCLVDDYSGDSGRLLALP